MLPEVIFLYDSAWSKVLQIDEIIIYLRNKTGVYTERRDDPFLKFKSYPQDKIEKIAYQLCSIRIRDIHSCSKIFPPLPGELSYELKVLSEPNLRIPGILYDGFKLQQFYFTLIPEEERKSCYLHIILTNQMFATWDRNDHRYHARVSIYSYPNLISTTGLVEAPAKPREYYLKRKMGIPHEILKEEMKERFLEYEDHRLTEIIKGYTLQSFFFHITGYPYCPDKNCRLFNAHWQEEVIYAQLKRGKELCAYHENMLSHFKEKLKEGEKNGEDFSNYQT